MLYSFDRFPDGPERSSFSRAIASDALDGPEGFKVDLVPGCGHDSLTLRRPFLACEKMLEQELSSIGL